MRTTLRPVPILLLLVAACGGSSAPPPPVATPTSGAATDAGVRPMSSRESAAAGAASAPFDAQAPLPAGHPPIGEPAGALPAGHPPLGEGGAAGMSTSTSTSAKASGTIAGTVSLGAGIATTPSDVLYVMAKKGGATLAVRRVESPAFPVAFELRGSDAMTGGADFAGPVDVVARLSRTGDAIPSAGDAEGTARSVPIPARAVKVTIDSVRK